METSKYFSNSQFSHLRLAIEAYLRGDGLTAIYHNAVYEKQLCYKRVLSQVEKKIIYLETFKVKIMREQEKYDPSLSWK